MKARHGNSYTWREVLIYLTIGSSLILPSIQGRLQCWVAMENQEALWPFLDTAGYNLYLFFLCSSLFNICFKNIFSKVNKTMVDITEGVNNQKKMLTLDFSKIGSRPSPTLSVPHWVITKVDTWHHKVLEPTAYILHQVQVKIRCLCPWKDHHVLLCWNAFMSDNRANPQDDEGQSQPTAAPQRCQLQPLITQEELFISSRTALPSNLLIISFAPIWNGCSKFNWVEDLKEF